MSFALALTIATIGIVLGLVWPRTVSWTRRVEHAVPFGLIKPNGRYDLKAVGESAYQHVLAAICGPRTAEGYQSSVFAILVPETDSHHEKDAVRIDIDSRTVGYLGVDDAKRYRGDLERQGWTDASLKVNALITGGWDRGEGDSGLFGVRLDVPQPPCITALPG
jgi:hypothetical protein